MRRQELDCQDHYYRVLDLQPPFRPSYPVNSPQNLQQQATNFPQQLVATGGPNQMLRDIKESLSHLRRETVPSATNNHINNEQTKSGVVVGAKYPNTKCDFMQIKSEFMNLSGTSNNASGGGGGSSAPVPGEAPRSNGGTGAVKSTRYGYREMALESIRNSLQPFANCDRSQSSASSTASDSGCYTNHSSSLGSHHGVGSSSGVSVSSHSGSHGPANNSGMLSLSSGAPNGLAERDLNQQRQALRHFLQMGYSEEMACRILRLPAMNDDLLQDSPSHNHQHLGQQESGSQTKDFVNGLPGLSSQPPPPPVPMGLKPLRKGSLQETSNQGAYVWDSRGPHSSSSHSQADCNSSNTSVRSDSPGMGGNSIPGLQRSMPANLLPSCDGGNIPANLVPFFRIQSQTTGYNASDAPPLPPPRGSVPPPTPPRGTTPPTPPPIPPSHMPSNMAKNNSMQQTMNHHAPPAPPPPQQMQTQHHQQQQIFKRRSPVPQPSSRNHPASATASPQRGTSPVSCGGRNSVGSIMSQPNLQHLLSRYSAGSTTSGGSSSRGGVEPPPPYPSCSSPSPSIYSSPPPSYASSSSGRQSPTPTISSSEYSIPLPPFNQKRFMSPSYNSSASPSVAGSSHISANPASSSPLGSNNSNNSVSSAPSALVTSVMPRPTPLQAWSVKQSQSPVIMQSVKSTQVQKPILQTAVAPTSPPPATGNTTSSGNGSSTQQGMPNGVVMGIATGPTSNSQGSYYPPVQGVISGYATSVPSPVVSSTNNVATATETYLPPYGTGLRKASLARTSHLPTVYPKAAMTPSPPTYSTALTQQQLPSPIDNNSQHLSPPPAYPSSVQNQNYHAQEKAAPHHRFGELKISDYGAPPPPPPPPDLPTIVPTTDPPSYASTVAVLSGQIISQSPINPVLNNNNNMHCYVPPTISSTSTNTQGGSGGVNGNLQQQEMNRNIMLDNFPSVLGNGGVTGNSDLVSTVESICHSNMSPPSDMNMLRSNLNALGGHDHSMLQRKNSPIAMDTSSTASRSASRSESPVSHGLSQSPVSFMSTTSTSSPSTQSDSTVAGGSRIPPPPPYIMTHQSPIPPRKILSKEKEEEKRETKVKNFSPAAFKFFMEQHVENLLKSHQQRQHRRQQLETEMAKVGLSEEAQRQMRRMLHQKESNYIRLKRAKMDKSMFVKIKAIGVGAFGEVALVRKMDTNQLYAMKTLRKNDVLKRNQVAHVKAERDILAEADNEWVVKLYYSFQDQDNLYFVMDYIPGGDLMSLLIKFSIFQEPLARFYIAELVLAVESVHKMGFIHRDIKPDNILIDRDGHIKLTDFGLCTGFRWTHNSKYYQRNGEHARQDSMEPEEGWSNECHCYTSTSLKPLERRRRREHQRCLAHSLVGTPNYIAPEVLLRTGYTQLCDWWSVGVILYEMLVGQPPFLASSPVETQIKVINWESSLHIPKAAKLTQESADLILNLCCGPEKRIGRNGAPEIKAHSFFSGMDLEVGLRKHPAPYIPQILYPTDTSNFDAIDSDKLKKSGSEFNSNDTTGEDDSYENGKHPQHAFFEFTFRRFFDDGGQAYPVRISLDNSNNGNNNNSALEQSGANNNGNQNEDGTQGSPVYV